MTNREFPGTIGKTIGESEPHWPSTTQPPTGAPNVLIMMLDDVGFADFGCYGSEIDTPNIDRLAQRGLRYTGFHTTAMCSTTRAALHTGRNHHSVGMGCLSNFDSGYPGYRGKIDPDAPTLAEMLKPHGYRSYYLGKWHVTPLTQTGPTGPFDGWPLGRGFDRFYGFLDAETDQYSPEMVRDNSHVAVAGNYETGYHVTEDLADNAIEMLAGHTAGVPDAPWMLMLMPGACHAPHQAPQHLIDKYDEIFAKGWDQTRLDRLQRQIELGIVPGGTELPDRNFMVQPWDDHPIEERRLFTRLAAAYAAMLEHADEHFGRVLDFLEASGQLDNTVVMALSDNGASQEGGPQGFVNAMGPYNMVKETIEDKIARIDDIGGPDTHSNFPWGWAMASNSPLKRYKQNTHGGGVRDPLVIAGPGIGRPDQPDGLRHNFCHVSDLAPTVLEAIGLPAPAGTEGVSFAATFPADVATTKSVQHFEMFGHRGIWLDGWKAVAFHQPGTAFDHDQWELYHLDEDFNERHDLATTRPEKLAELVDRWWVEAEKHQVLPLDDRFAERFAENAERHRGDRTNYTFWKGMGHIPSEVAPDLRSRSYTIEATCEITDEGASGVLIAHGDATSGYSLFVRDGQLVHDLNVGGQHQLVVSDRPVPLGTVTLGFRMRRSETGGPTPSGVGTLLINGEPAGSFETDRIFWLMISWSGLDIGFDRGTTVSDYDGTGRFMGPFTFTGELVKVVVDLDDDQHVNQAAAAENEVARD
ncbi:MAG TPA: arylsulfatase [Acidimicrobiaceae bacterium]|nr:arylsulfatase [Acidimicrobiaceae bacterium]